MWLTPRTRLICIRATLRWGSGPQGPLATASHPDALIPRAKPVPLPQAVGRTPSEASPSCSLAECDTQLIIAESLGYGTYTKSLKAHIMSLTMGIRAYAKTLCD